MANKITILESGEFEMVIPPKDGVKRTVNLDIVHNLGRFKIEADNGDYSHTSISSFTVENQGATITAMPFNLTDINDFGGDYIYAGTIFPLADNTNKFARITKDANGNLVVGLEDNPYIGRDDYELLSSTNIYGETVPVQVCNGRTQPYIQNFFRDKDNVTSDDYFNSMKKGYSNYKGLTIIFSFYVDDPDSKYSDGNMVFRNFSDNNYMYVKLNRCGMTIDSGTWYSVCITSKAGDDNGWLGLNNSSYMYSHIYNETTGDVANFKFDNTDNSYYGGKLWFGGLKDNDGNPVKIRYSQIRVFRECLEYDLAREISLRQLPTDTGN